MAESPTILVIGPRWVGDMVMAQCLFSALKELYPNAAIDGGHSCPHCGHDKLQARGFQHSKTRRYKRFQCKSCGGWSKAVACEPGSAKLVGVA